MTRFLIVLLIIVGFGCEKGEQCYSCKVVASNNEKIACGRANNGWDITSEIIVDDVCGEDKLKSLRESTYSETYVNLKCRTDESSTKITYKVELICNPK